MQIRERESGGVARFSRISHRGCQKYLRMQAPGVNCAGLELQLAAATLHKHLRNA